MYIYVVNILGSNIALIQVLSSLLLFENLIEIEYKCIRIIGTILYKPQIVIVLVFLHFRRKIF